MPSPNPSSNIASRCVQYPPPALSLELGLQARAWPQWVAQSSQEREPLNECVCVHVPYLDAAVHDGRWAVQASSYSIHHVLNQIHRFTSVSLSLSVQSVRVVLILLCTNAYKRTGIRTTINRFERSADIKCTPHVVEERSRNRRPILSILLYTAAR